MSPFCNLCNMFAAMAPRCWSPIAHAEQVDERDYHMHEVLYKSIKFLSGHRGRSDLS